MTFFCRFNTEMKDVFCRRQFNTDASAFSPSVTHFPPFEEDQDHGHRTLTPDSHRHAQHSQSEQQDLSGTFCSTSFASSSTCWRQAEGSGCCGGGDSAREQARKMWAPGDCVWIMCSQGSSSSMIWSTVRLSSGEKSSANRLLLRKRNKNLSDNDRIAQGFVSNMILLIITE